MKKTLVKESVLPGFKITMGFTLLYLLLIVILPLSSLFFKTSTMSWADLWQTLSSERLWAACRLSFGASFLAALINTFIGAIIAWVLVRYEFFGKPLVDMLVDLPIALPTAVAGIALVATFSSKGLIGQYLEPLGVKIIFNRAGVVLALVFVTFPFVVRTVQPIFKDLDLSVEEAAASLGAKRFQVFRHVILPAIMPSLLSGFTLAFARALGEYGSVVFISGNLPFKTEIAPLLIVGKLEQYDYQGATAIAAVLLSVSFIMLVLINILTSGRFNFSKILKRWRSS